MKIVIKSPILAYLEGATPSELALLKDQFAYKNGKIDQLLKRHKANNWFKQKNPVGWEERYDELAPLLNDSVLKKDSHGYYIKPASIPYIKGVEYDLSCEVNVPDLAPIPWKVQPEFTPYPYQSDSVRELLKLKGIPGNISLPTGCGKSFILLMLSQQIGKGVVIVTPSKSIFRELYAEFQLRLGKNNVGGYGDGKKDIKKPITIAIGRSITMLKEDTPAYEFFQNKTSLLVDESHTWGADTLENISHGVLGGCVRRLFVSATQTRGDGMLVLLQSIIGKNVYSMEITDAIAKGYLCPLKFNVIPVISPDTRYKKDPLECKRLHFLYNTEIAKIAAKIANAQWRVNQESTLILVDELVQIKRLAELLEVPFTYIHSASKKVAAENGLNKVDLTEELERFNNGEVKVLIGTKSIATGTNIYPTHHTINFSGGSSEINTKQGPMGRSTRWIKKKYINQHKEKKFTQIWDFDVTNQPILTQMLKKRIRYYEETGEKVNVLKT